MRRERTEVFVGMFVIGGIIIFTLMIFLVSGVAFFRTGYSVTVIFEYVSILDKGAPVRMAGVRVGEVSRVALVEDEEMGKMRVHVKLFIEKGVEIRENYQFNIRGTHILSEPHIEISPQPGSASMIQPGAVIEGVEPTPVEALIERANHIAENIDGVFETLKGAVGDEESQNAVKNIMLNWARMSESLSKILAGSEDDFKEAIRHMNASSEALNNILGKISRGEGSAGKLVMEDELYAEMRAFVAEIRAHPWRLLKKDDGRKKILWIF